ncbi:DUF72 domain-containing protein [Pseudomonas sp. GD03860]|uniref:DUF72 domain-containing protein n=1 Tax=Pseudomonas TaxID=286 RepID=UPI0023639BFB|nr:MULTISPECIES: DUF72 domain-containing protein [Pseudomonas]MDD2058163.1 DUF72 domain-containing protein [Pseudomonas putida]MDH0636096.1 DUF72 domain-containing protein [Pseudomonas sp. GD03860]
MKATQARMHIGISGWRYGPWRGVFYPEGLRQQDELSFASRAVNSIEINGTFYALQRPERFAQWAADTPEGFVFSVKAPRYITHMRRLRDIAEPLANFYASGPLMLGAKLGPTLWQFPPSMKFDPALFDDFLAQLPRTAAQAGKLAQQSPRLTPPDNVPASPGQALRHAVEIRHPSFVTPEFVALLRRHDVALVVADTAGKWPQVEDVTSTFIYLRLHGDKQLYRSGYSDPALQRWYKRILAWRRGAQPGGAQLIDKDTRPPAASTRDVYCYFDNDIKVHAPFDARRLLAMLKLDKSLQTTPGG